MGRLPQRAGSPGLNGSGAAAAVPPLILTPIESTYGTFYWSLIVWSYFRDIRVFVSRRPLFLTPPLFRPKFWSVPHIVGVCKERTSQAS